MTSSNSLNRFDWNMGQSHIVTVSTSFGLNSQDPTRIGQTQLQQVGGNSSSATAGRSACRSPRAWAGGSTSSAAAARINDSNSDPFLFVPVGRVTNQSTLDSGQIAMTTFGFGGNAGLPQHNNTKNLEITNELSVLPGNADHRFALGLYAFGSHFNQDATNNRYGTYTYNSLDDFLNNIPSQFTRTLQPTIRDGGAWNEAVYLSDAWRPRTARRVATTAADSMAAARGGRGVGGGGGGGFGGGGGGGGGVDAGAAAAAEVSAAARRQQQLPADLRRAPGAFFVHRRPGAQRLGVP